MITWLLRAASGGVPSTEANCQTLTALSAGVAWPGVV